MLVTITMYLIKCLLIRLNYNNLLNTYFMILDKFLHTRSRLFSHHSSSPLVIVLSFTNFISWSCSSYVTSLLTSCSSISRELLLFLFHLAIFYPQLLSLSRPAHPPEREAKRETDRKTSSQCYFYDFDKWSVCIMSALL